ncbi:alpha/beta family hydrolase [Pararhodobacter zhoushanensis]|uniref:KANL3/Tex30 alpha/beta hydrolase-like domain-containing protein n=1 Tax=Pararhodobacter zhoushanensis TaxID=2479545 RepID=A0ABT3H007_9RHOB|nr:alpha/beta family hydrolase [Pararhodobacter zhoushanensis]MCW1933106.1 hypothetical protein [Pararhodobacter zhoushanensis]
MSEAALFYSMMGDSFPADQYIEDAFVALRPVELVPFADLVARRVTPGRWITLPQRIAALKAEILSHPGRRAVVVGRSSGGVAATQLAADVPGLISGIIVLGYPFKNPNRPDEPHRYQHLATLETPTLIVQGQQDVYGTPTRLSQVTLSAAIRYEEIATNHEFTRPAPDWQAIGRLIDGFLASL